MFFFFGKSQDKWDQNIQQIAMAIRASVNRSTGFTPNKLILGREVNTPAQLMFPKAREEKDKERTQGKSRVRLRTCFVPGCDPQRYLKAHVLKEHIPGIVTETLPPRDPQVLRRRKKALLQAARWLLSRPATLDELLNFVKIQRLMSVADNSSISEVQHEAMVELCKFLKDPVPRESRLEPANSTGVIIHWKAVLLISVSLEEEEREKRPLKKRVWLGTYKRQRNR